MTFYNSRHIVLDGKIQQHGHAVYVRAQYKPGDGSRIPIIYKENKHNNTMFSQFEVAFGELARLFLASNLTSPTVLVKNNADEIMGVASEHISLTIARRETLPQIFYNLNKKAPFIYNGLNVTTASEIPYCFLDQLPPDFFSTLRRDAARGIISLDLESLAEVFTGAYSLEEDDLHKGNLGFYVIQKNNKPHVVFFKIDHDYMLADSVMSHWRSRFGNCLYGATAYNITQRDLTNFPRLTDSQNYYWPTINRPVLATGSKAYTSIVETHAFASLANEEAFISAKWQAFYRHILIPPALIQQSLSTQLDTNNPVCRAQIALITQSVVSRQAKLRAVLFAIPAFRDFVRSLSDEKRLAIVQGIAGRAEPATAATFTTEIEQSIERHKILCHPTGGIVVGDTPLHVAIRLQDYRYFDTWQAFGHFAEKTNSASEKPLDVAIKMAQLPQVPATYDPRRDLTCTIKHMLQQGAKKTVAYNTAYSTCINLNDYLTHSSYSIRAQSIGAVSELKALLGELGEDYRYSLKMQKESAVVCVRQFINRQQANPQLRTMLSTLKTEMNGTPTRPPAPELQFIRQLRSQLWFVRFIRGLLGGTSTQVQLNSIIDNEIKRITPSCSSFFTRRSVMEDATIKSVPGFHTPAPL